MSLISQMAPEKDTDMDACLRRHDEEGGRTHQKLYRACTPNQRGVA